MIKVGIAGAETMAAGELIRILINHPDVELVTIASDELAGRKVDDVHRGLIGECSTTIVPQLDAKGHHVVFLCGEPWMARDWMSRNIDQIEADEIKVIDLTGAFRDGSYDMVYGLPEYNRKALVRGATRTSIPSAPANIIELALFPLAKNMLLTGNINATVKLHDLPLNSSTDNAAAPALRLDNEAIATSTRFDPVAPQEHRLDPNTAAAEIEATMRNIQPNFNGNLHLTLSRDNHERRGIMATIDLDCGISLAEINRLYSDAYHDHNFTYPIARTPQTDDISNTNKCLIFTTYPNDGNTPTGRLRIIAVIDNLLKGSAGTAVHCMNLLFGLSERTGLCLKSSSF